MEKEDKIKRKPEEVRPRIKLGDRVKYENREYVVTNLNKNGTCHIAMNELQHDVGFKEVILINK